MLDEILGDYAPYKIAMYKKEQLLSQGAFEKLQKIVKNTNEMYKKSGIAPEYIVTEQEFEKLDNLYQKIKAFDYANRDKAVSSYEHYKNYADLIQKLKVEWEGVFEKIKQSSLKSNDQLDTTTLQKAINLNLENLISNSQIVLNPEGVLDMLWILRDEEDWILSNQLQQKSEFHKIYLQTIQEIKEGLIRFRQTQQPEEIESIWKLIDKIEKQANSPEEQALTEHLKGVKQECQYIEYKAQMLRIRERLDLIQGELTSELQKSNLKFNSGQKLLREKYKIKDKKSKKPKSIFGKIWSGIKFGFSALNIARTFRESRFVKEYSKLSNEHTREKREVTKAHKEKYGHEWKTLHEKLSKMETELQTKIGDDTLHLIMPTSFVYHQNLKAKIVEHQGMMIGGLSQGRISELGSSGGLCYGISKEFLVRLNAYREQNLSDAEMIDRFDLYAKKINNESEYFSTAVNNLSDDFKYRHYFADQVKEKDFDKDGKKRSKHNLDQKFWHDRILQLDTDNSQIINLHKKSGSGGHAIAIAKTQHGIWVHDSNAFCVLFPNAGDQDALHRNVEDFLYTYVKENYPGYGAGSVVPITEQMDKLPSPLFTDSTESIEKILKDSVQQNHGLSKEPVSPNLQEEVTKDLKHSGQAKKPSS